MSEADALAGAIVQKVDRPVDGVTVLSLRLPGRTVLLGVVAARESIAIGEIARSPKRAASERGVDSELRRWRNELEGSRVLRLLHRLDGAWHRLELVRGGEARSIVATATGATLLVGGAASMVDGESTELADGGGGSVGGADRSHRAEAEAALTRRLDALFEARRREVLGALQRAARRLSQRIEAVRGDLAKIERADALIARATLLSTHTHAIARGATEAVVEDWSTGEATTVRIPLDPSKGAREQADALFHRGKRLKRGFAIAEARLAEAIRAHHAVDALRTLATESETADALEIVAARAASLGAKAKRGDGAGKRAAAPERVPYRTYRCGDRAILVGRSAQDNDSLTTRVAKPHDLWLHAKSVTGAHVVVPLGKGESCPAELLVDAAHLAAHFSDAREERVVDVAYVARRYVRKPRGAAAGAVSIEREKVLVLRVDAARLARLLATGD